MDAENTAMAEGLTDRIWSLSELLCFRVPVQKNYGIAKNPKNATISAR